MEAAAKNPPRFIDAYAGAGAGLVGTLIGYPLDVVKGRMQVEAGATIRSVVRAVYRGEGLVGFYRGVLPPMLSLTMLNTVNFSNYAMAVTALSIDRSHSKGFNHLIFLAGATVGPAAAFISTPFEFLKIQLQFSKKNGVAYKNTLDAARAVCKSHGIQALYTGHIINTYREMLFLGTYFSTYEYVKKLLDKKVGSSVAVPVSGGLAGAVGWLVSFPLDAVKTNIQSIRIDSSSNLSLSSISIKDAAIKLMKERGFLNMYRGVAPSIIRAFIVSSSRFTVYETILWYLSEK